jgi:hypothetical protein
VVSELKPLKVRESLEGRIGMHKNVRDHFHSMAIGLDYGGVSTGILIERHGDCSHRSLRTTRGSVGDIGT